MPVSNRKKLYNLESDLNLLDLGSGNRNKAVRQKAQSQLSEIMRPAWTTLNLDDPLARIIYKKITMDITLLPVLGHGEVIGAVRTVEVFSETSRILA